MFFSENVRSHSSQPLCLQPSEMTMNLLDDLNFATACWVAFAGFLRLGEFTYKADDLGTHSILLAAKLTRSDVIFSSSLHHVQLTLKWSKMDRRHEWVQIILAKTGDGACPVNAPQKLLEDQRPRCSPSIESHSVATIFSLPYLLS